MQILLIFSLVTIIILSGLASIGWYIAYKRKNEIKAINFKAAKIFDEKNKIIDEKEQCLQYLEKKMKVGEFYEVAQKVNSNKDLYPHN